jgi:hypothetical protein
MHPESTIPERSTVVQSPPLNLSLLQVGSVVYYRLLPSENPTHPNKLWAGRVLKVIPDSHLLFVDLLESGYQGLQEYVWLEQVVGIDDEGEKR